MIRRLNFAVSLAVLTTALHADNNNHGFTATLKNCTELIGFGPVPFESAEAYLDASPAPFCLIVDVGLPGMSGMELQERLCAAGVAPPIIVITAHQDAAIRERSHKNGCAAFFLKPVDGDLLIAAIESLANSPSIIG